MTELWWTRRSAVAAVSDVLAECADVLGDDAIGWLGSPTRLRAVRGDASGLRDPQGPVDPAGAFMLRLFGPDAELRWVQSGAGLGRAVLVAEAPMTILGWTPGAAPVVDVIDGAYALWGRRFGASPGPGWCRATERRTGPVDIPVHGPAPAPTSGDGAAWPAEYLSLTCREYVGVDEHGNAGVVEERLCSIVAALPTTGSRS